MSRPNDLRKQALEIAAAQASNLLDFSSIIKRLGIATLPSLDNIQKVIRELAAPIQSTYEQVISAATAFNTKIEEFNNAVLRPQLSMINDWAKLQDEKIRKMQEWARRIEEEERDSLEILRRYQWLFSPNISISLLAEVRKLKRSLKSERQARLNQLFIEYFFSNGCENWTLLLHEWEMNSHLKHRKKVIRDCISAMSMSSKTFNASNVVLPTLIAQIDGFQTDYALANGLFIHSRNKWKDVNGKVVRREQWIQSQVTEEAMDKLCGDILVDVLFQTAYTRRPPQSNSWTIFNRHKIMHGECVTYGRRDNVARAVLLLDFLSSLPSN